MRKQVLKFSVHQSSKVIAIVYFVFFAILAIPWGIYIAAMAGLAESLVIFLIPLIYAVIGYLVSIVFFFLYNLVAGTFGGIEFLVGDRDHKETEEIK